LPVLYPPTKIDGRYFVDGALKKTLHASVALKEGATLVFCINPLVPFDASLARAHGKHSHGKLVDGGLPVVLSQTFRSLIHSRMQVGMAKYGTAYKGADVLLFEPNPDDAEMFFANVFSHANRERVCDHAYRHTIHELARREPELAPILARHGISLRSELVRQERPHVKSSISLRLASGEGLRHRLDSSLHELRQWLHARAQSA
jgi:predicted acylesterase/phospholipase RssA